MISRAESAALEGWISMEKKTILVVGLGLIGGSLSMALQGFAVILTGYPLRNPLILRMTHPLPAPWPMKQLSSSKQAQAGNGFSL